MTLIARIIESLAEDGPQTAAQLARRLGASRTHTTTALKMEAARRPEWFTTSRAIHLREGDRGSVPKLWSLAD